MAGRRRTYEKPDALIGQITRATYEYFSGKSAAPEAPPRNFSAEP
jgi:hypothetical protein